MANNWYSVNSMASTTVYVRDMISEASVASIEAAFLHVQGVYGVNGSLALSHAVIQYDPLELLPAKIIELIDKVGFGAEVLLTEIDSIEADLNVLDADEQREPIDSSQVLTTKLYVGGLQGTTPLSDVKDALKDIAGIKSYFAPRMEPIITIEHYPSILPPQKITEIIESVGYLSLLLSSEKSYPPSEMELKQRNKLEQAKLRTTIWIGNMKDKSCASAVEEVLAPLEGITQFSISLMANRAILIHDPEKIKAQQIVEIIRERGFAACIRVSEVAATRLPPPSVTELKIRMILNQYEAAKLEQLIQGLAGVLKTRLNIYRFNLIVKYIPTLINPQKLVKQIEQAGYDGTIKETYSTEFESSVPLYRTPRYEYSPLLDSDSVRLLLLKPAWRHSEIPECEIVQTSLSCCGISRENAHDFTALSYVWGSTAKPKFIWIGDKEFFVGINLYEALTHLRQTKDAIYVWADAICINQEDSYERNHQVHQMRNIYSKASMTVIYLGDSVGTHSQSAWNFLERKSCDKGLRKLKEKETDFRGTIEDVEIAILNRSWFRRVWVFREVVVSSNPIVQSGWRSVTWDDFCKATLLKPRLHDRYGLVFFRAG
jgi:copper chaperone CopZ